MKKLTSILVIVVSIFFFSCSSNSGNKDGVISDSVTAASAEVKPFKTMMVQHSVADFDKWMTAYLAHDSMRNAYGISRLTVGRGIDDPNFVVVINRMDDVQRAKEFSSLPDLKGAMDMAGVTSAPAFSYLDVVRADTSKIDQKDRVMISHRVKDYDAWLKVYDEEGKESRASNGAIDRALARGIDDPNMVYIVFAISDMEKFKARVGSEELKNLMTQAGVEGPPQTIFYKLVD